MRKVITISSPDEINEELMERMRRAYAEQEEGVDLRIEIKVRNAAVVPTRVKQMTPHKPWRGKIKLTEEEFEAKMRDGDEQIARGQVHRFSSAEDLQKYVEEQARK